MKLRITVITICVDNLEASLCFYRDGLGFSTEGIIGKEFEYGAVVFIDLQYGLRLALWPRKSIAHDTGLVAGATNPAEMTLGHNVSSKVEVDAVMAGATLPRPSSNLHTTRSGAATRAISRIQTDTSGKLSGIRSGLGEYKA